MKPSLSDYYLTEQDLDQLMQHLVDEEGDPSTVLSFADRVEFAPEQVLIHESDSDAAVYILTEGKLDVTVEVDGKEQTVASIEPHALFGEMTFIDGGPRTATVIARSTGVAYRLTDSGFDQLTAAHPEVACAFLRDVSRTLARRLRSRG